MCTANICRSPMMEAWARHLLGRDADDVAVSSAGARGLEGEPMHPLAVQALRERGAAPGGFVARQLRPEWVGAADLTLTADRWHRDLLLDHVPDAFGRLFTLRECAWLLAGSPVTGVGDVSSLARVADDRRRTAGRAVPNDLDLGDPVGRDIQAFRDCLDSISAAVSLLVQALR